MSGVSFANGAVWRSIRRLGVLLGIVVAALWLCDRVLGIIATLPDPHQGMVMWGLLAGLLVAYALLISVPFVPGVEIGVMLLVLRGAEIAAPVYLATLAGLMLAFLIGRFVPSRLLARVFADLNMRRAAALLLASDPLTPTQRLAHLRQRLPRWARPMVRYRYLVVAAVLNLPGNAILGGGGGICLAAGLSGLYSVRAMALLLAIAVAPVPLAVWLLDIDLMSWLGHGG